jgi:hypothetical protein
MNIALSLKPSRGPAGGGISFLNNLIFGLELKGHKVFFELRSKEIDIILLLDPRWNHSNNAFNSKDVLKYINSINSNVIVVHRINECDERKKTHLMNRKLRQINYLADASIFVGKWLLDLKVTNKFSFHDLDIVIRNGADKSIFNNYKFKPWIGNGPLKLITHHWSGNRMKGFDIYERLDSLLGQKEYRNEFTFTYIGNLPKKFVFKNSVHVQPIHGELLATKIQEHHGYITASINEPGGNHQNEGAACGLPLLYRNSGCLPEYCEGYGVMFDENNFETKLIQFRNTYNDYVNLMSSYPNTADTMVNNYLDFFEFLLVKRGYIASRRKISKFSISALRLNFPI